jgi:hypothetical protein
MDGWLAFFMWLLRWMGLGSVCGLRIVCVNRGLDGVGIRRSNGCKIPSWEDGGGGVV